jgi:hypothetical protein
VLHWREKMTLLLTGYASKKELKASIGQPLKHQETSFFGAEYKDDGSFVAAHRPALGVHRVGREFFAEITMKGGLIESID